MAEWLYRRAVNLKELGERAHCRLLVVLGLWLRDKVCSHLIIYRP
jgi:hypothetical protein